ncbi:MAG: response regulator [Idiomarina sp.]|nr:response regulator [Idiomarina sp.]
MSGSKVLVIEDDAVFSNILGRFLTQRGYQVVSAEDGETGLALCTSEQPDVVLCDLMLPKLSGLEVLERLILSMAATPVIVISASERMADIREALRLGAWDYLVKPLRELDVLDTAIQNCLTRSGLEDAWERERWELDDHIDVLFENDDMIAHLTADLVSHETLELPCGVISHRLGEGAGDRFLLDYFRFPDNNALIFMANAQSSGSQGVISLLVLKSLLNPLVRIAMAGNDAMMRTPHRLLERLNSELCHSRIRSAFDVVAVWVNGNTGDMEWGHGGDRIQLSVDSRPDLALGIWAQAQFTEHKGKLNSADFVIQADTTRITVTPHR